MIPQLEYIHRRLSFIEAQLRGRADIKTLERLLTELTLYEIQLKNMLEQEKNPDVKKEIEKQLALIERLKKIIASSIMLRSAVRIDRAFRSFAEWYVERLVRR